ncbi:Glycerol-3-phosphate dehydrogenase [NAD(P)+] [hydrothermal vent metagenome]|uniref:Glycerol-3-phosphate dehydrogenase [NAD(P)+] n=1 Tax=hydrothermal vent metagenome TaxID=652676 RepID=A0A3B0X9J5_9ZZZZ
MTAADKSHPIAVLGAGSWGTALAMHLANSGRNVLLWGNEPEHVQLLSEQRCNQQYLPDVTFPDLLQVTDDLTQTLVSPAWILIAIPSHAYRPFLQKNAHLFGENIGVAWASKGIESGSGKLIHQIIAEELPQCKKTAVLSGPTFAGEVARNLPTSITAASKSASFSKQIIDDLHSGRFRVYLSDDLTGVELGGALKNVLAIAAGAADGLGFGANTRAALITRGLAEMMRLGEAMGGKRETFMGLAGMGDLILTCTDDQSRNRRTGLLLAQGKSQAQIHEEIGQAIEGIKTAKEVVSLAQKYGVEVPISEQVHRVLYENCPIDEAVRNLLSRKSSQETV